MGIRNVIARGLGIFAYDDNGKQVGAAPASFDSDNKDDGLVGYTTKGFSVKRGNTTFNYNEKGQNVSQSTDWTKG